MLCYQYLDTDQVSGLSDKYNRKRYHIRVITEGRLYEYLVRIVLIIGPELDIMQKSFSTRKSTYIELNFRKKNQCARLKVCF